MADSLKEFPFRIRVRRMRLQRERKDGIQLPKLRDEILPRLAEVQPCILKSLFLSILQRAYDIESGQVFKLLEIHFFGFLGRFVRLLRNF